MDIWDQIENQINIRSESQNDNNTIIQTISKKPRSTLYDTKFTINITRDGTYILIKSHTQEFLKKIKNYFTLHDKTVMGYFKHTSLWKLTKDKLYIPRFGSFLLKNKFKTVTYISSILPQNPLPNMRYDGTFKGNQEIIYNHIMTKFFNPESVNIGSSGLILNEKAGRGKTFLAMYLIGVLKCKTLIVTHNTTMLGGWVKEITEKFTGVSVGQYYGKKKIDGDIVVGVINSLITDEFKFKKETVKASEYYKTFDFIILDECHEFYSEVRRKLYDKCSPTYMLGLSATPDERNDTLYKVGHYCIGPLLEAEKLEEYSEKEINFKGHVTKISYSGPTEYTEHIITESTGLTSVPLLIGQICEDPYRLEMVVNLILEQNKLGLNVLVFADRRSYLAIIQEALDIKSYMLTDENEQRVLESVNLMGGNTALQIREAEQNNNVILTTYQFMGTGVSIPKLNSVVLTTPRKSKSKQFINRIFRLGSNYDIERQIIDIVDTKISLKSQWYARKEYYDSQNFPIEDKKISWKTYKI
jgi:superfamily II DNA or RNA helicase